LFASGWNTALGAEKIRQSPALKRDARSHLAPHAPRTMRFDRTPADFRPRDLTRGAYFAPFLALVLGCSSSETPTGGSGGTPSAGTAGTPGGGAGSAGLGGTATGGVAGSAGTAGSTSAGSAGLGGTTAGSGGANAGSAGTLAGAGGVSGAAGSAGSAGTTAGNAGSAGESAGASGSGGGANCDDGTRNGDETGVDCGGSCEACVPYQTDPPLEDNPGARSACEANGSGFMCPQSMVFSPYMVQAAKDDFNTGDPPFVYGVVGHDPDPGGVDGESSNYASTCCQCYQLVFKGPRDAAVSVPLPKPMIVQAFNTYAGGPTAFDVYMAVGGHGNFNGCTANGTQYTGYPDTGGDWSGGARATRYSQCSMNGYTEASIGSAQCQDYVASQCNEIEASELTQSISRESCIATNRVDTHYHMNWNVVVKRVECPMNLTRVTGCRLNPQGLPQADPEIDTVTEAMANGFRDSDYHTTTMQDCCRPTCAWPDNTENTADEYSLFYSCDREGNPYVE
jgi:hypothetical protein